MDILRKIVWCCFFCSFGLVIATWENDYAKTHEKISDNQVAIAPTSSIHNLEKIVPKKYRVSFKTDTLQGVIDTRGGHLVELKLLQYPQYMGKDAPPVALLARNTTRYYTAHTDVATTIEKRFVKKDHHYRSERQAYVLESGQQTLRIPLYHQEAQGILERGVSLMKEFVLKPNSYEIDINYQVENNSPKVWRGQIYAELNNATSKVRKGWLDMASYTGGAISTDKKSYQKIKFNQIDHLNLPQQFQAKWLALIEPHFASAWISKLPSASYYSSEKNNIYTLGLLSAPWQVEPGQTQSRQISLYAGPKIIEKLSAAAKHLELIVDYGIFWWLATGLFGLLKYCYQWTGNWGWAIVLLTSIIQLAFSRMTAKDFRAMLTRQKLSPELSVLKERYSQDPHRLLQAESELYKKEGLKPRNGFLSGLMTAPISFTLYWLLLENVELRHKPFILWIRDLSSQDPYYILPFLFGLFTFVNNSLTPAKSNDPTQERIALLLPAFLTWLFLNVPAGLTLYWVVNNLLSILQKLWIWRELPFEQIMPYRNK